MICGLWYESFEPSRPYPNEKNAKGILIDLDKHKPARSDGSWLTKLRVTCGIPSTHRFFRKGIGQLRNAVECPIGFFQLRNFWRAEHFVSASQRVHFTELVLLRTVYFCLLCCYLGPHGWTAAEYHSLTAPFTGRSCASCVVWNTAPGIHGRSCTAAHMATSAVTTDHPCCRSMAEMLRRPASAHCEQDEVSNHANWSIEMAPVHHRNLFKP